MSITSIKAKPDKLPDIFKSLRISANLTQRQLAQRLGCQAVTIARYESGKRKIPLEVMERVAGLAGFEFCLYFHHKRQQDEHS